MLVLRLVAIAGAVAANLLSDRRVKCFLEGFYELVDISADARLKANAYLRSLDLAQRRTLDDLTRIEFFDEVDFKLPDKIGRIILNVNQMNNQLRRVIENCFPPSQELLRRCQDAFPDDGCELFDGFVAARNCPKGFFGVDWVYCVPHCPSNYDEDPDDPFVCRKTEVSNFSFNLAARHGIITQVGQPEQKFWPHLIHGSTRDLEDFKKLRAQRNANNSTEKPPQTTEDKWDPNDLKDKAMIARRRHQLIQSELPCPDGYLKIGADICVRQCPLGWSDYGSVCAKPLVRRRDYELFFFSLDVDGKENQVEQPQPDFES